jgi:hypothetical protein
MNVKKDRESRSRLRLLIVWLFHCRVSHEQLLSVLHIFSCRKSSSEGRSHNYVTDIANSCSCRCVSVHLYCLSRKLVTRSDIGATSRESECCQRNLRIQEAFVLAYIAIAVCEQFAVSMLSLAYTSTQMSVRHIVTFSEIRFHNYFVVATEVSRWILSTPFRNCYEQPSLLYWYKSVVRRGKLFTEVPEDL